MAIRKNILPLAAMEKLLKQAGSDRVSEDAKEELRIVLENHALDVGRRASHLAKHAKRTTVRREDIRLAGGRQ